MTRPGTRRRGPPAVSRPLRLVSRQAESMAENDRYWPEGFFDELVAMSGEDLDDLPLSARLDDMHRRAAEELTSDMIADPRRVLSAQAGQRAAFEARLEARWGRGLDLADLMIHEALESGMWAHGLAAPSAATNEDHRFEALVRLHGKAVMTAGEVMVLLRCGYSSGALARWRTLHEVWVVFHRYCSDGDEELSRRYLPPRRRREPQGAGGVRSDLGGSRT